jgi:hypothetical protein
MSGVIHDFSCAAHGTFTKRVKAGTIPKCPRGCGKSLVTLIFTQAPGFVSARTRRGDKLTKEMAQIQGLSDLSTSPSRPGGSVMDRIRRKYGGHLQPEQMPRAVDAKAYLGAMTHRANEITGENMRAFTGGSHPGHEYDPAQWKKDEKSGVVRHVDIPHESFLPSASVERVREKP